MTEQRPAAEQPQDAEATTAEDIKWALHKVVNAGTDMRILGRKEWRPEITQQHIAKAELRLREAAEELVRQVQARASALEAYARHREGCEETEWAAWKRSDWRHPDPKPPCSCGLVALQEEAEDG